MQYDSTRNKPAHVGEINSAQLPLQRCQLCLSAAAAHPNLIARCDEAIVYPYAPANPATHSSSAPLPSHPSRTINAKKKEPSSPCVLRRITNTLLLIKLSYTHVHEPWRLAQLSFFKFSSSGTAPLPLLSGYKPRKYNLLFRGKKKKKKEKLPSQRKSKTRR